MIPFSGVRRTAPSVRVTRLPTAAVTAAGQFVVVPQPRNNRRLNLRDRSGCHTARAQTSLCPYADVLTGTLRAEVARHLSAGRSEERCCHAEVAACPSTRDGSSRQCWLQA